MHLLLLLFLNISLINDDGVKEKKGLGSIWLTGFEGEGGIILNFLCLLVQFLEGEGRERKGSKIPRKLIYCSPST